MLTALLCFYFWGCGVTSVLCIMFFVSQRTQEPTSIYALLLAILLWPVLLCMLLILAVIAFKELRL